MEFFHATFPIKTKIPYFALRKQPCIWGEHLGVCIIVWTRCALKVWIRNLAGFPANVPARKWTHMLVDRCITWSCSRSLEAVKQASTSFAHNKNLHWNHCTARVLASCAQWLRLPCSETNLQIVPQFWCIWKTAQQLPQYPPIAPNYPPSEITGICLRHDTIAVRSTPSNGLYCEECSRNSNFNYEMTNYDAHSSRSVWSSADFKLQSGQVTSKPLYKYIYIYKHEAIQKPFSENNIGAPTAPQQSIQFVWSCVIQCLMFEIHTVCVWVKDNS